MNEELRCIGCGVVIQTTDKEGIGYTPPSALKKGLESGELYCQRCFRLRHYNDIQDVSLTDDDFLNLLNTIGSEDALIVNVVDIVDFNGSLIPGLHRFVGKNPVLLVGNKVDILPKSLKRGKLTQWMRERAHEAGLRPEDVVLVSAKKQTDMLALLETIEKHRQGKDVYVVGVTNVGKSTLINGIIKATADLQDVITTSQFPGTTLDKIEIPLEDGRFLIDTPGIIHHHQMAHYLAKDELKIISPKKEIKPKTYQLNAGQTLFLGALVRVDYVKGERNAFTAYVSNELDIHRTKSEKAADFYLKHAGTLLQPPHISHLADFPELVAHEIKATPQTDIVISGLGWISIKEAAIVVVHAPKGVEVIRRKSLI